MARSRSSRGQGARGHRVGASGSVLAQRGRQPAPQPGSAWLGARRAARSEQAGASAAAWRPPRPPPSLGTKNSGGAGVVQDASKQALSPQKNSPLGARSAKRRRRRRRRRGGAGTHQPASRGHRPCSSPWGRHRPRSPKRQQGRGASRGLRSAASRYQALQRAGALPGSAAAACPPGRLLLQGQELGVSPPKPRAAGTFARLRPQRWHAGTRGGGGGAAELPGGRGRSACTTESASEARAARLRNLTNIRPVPPGLSPPPRRCALPARATRQGLVPSPRPRFGALVAPRGALG